MKLSKLLITLLCVGMTSWTAAQDELPLESLSEPVQKFINTNGTDLSQYIGTLKSWDQCPADFFTHIKSYQVEGQIDEVFERFIRLSPVDAWKGTSHFELAWDNNTQTAYDRSSPSFPAISEGQTYFLTLKLPLGLKIPVSFEFVEVDPVNHIVAFSYVKQNKSQGLQWIEISQQDSQVVFTHKTCYKSGKEFRDRRLYPWLHEKLVDQFYEAALPLL